jgi:hypothetical protein
MDGVASLREQASAPVATGSYGRLYARNDGHLYFLDDGGVERKLSGISTLYSGRINSITGNVNDTRFSSPIGVTSEGGGLVPESNFTVLSPNVACTAQNLAMQVTVAPGAGATRTFTLMVNGTASALDCTISGSATTCDSGPDVAGIPAASTLSFRQTTGATAPSTAGGASVLFGFECR